tara:strand:+ start:769 stop:1350 length:582 start_codon:yes stop_codon:yes gene_type:complete
MSIKLQHSGGNSVSLSPPTAAPTSSEVAFKLPNADGSAGQVLMTDGSGNLSWTTPGAGKVLQVVENTSNTTVTTTAGSNDELDLISLSITPASASNKVLLFVTFVGQAAPSTNSKAHVRLYRGTSSGTKILDLKQGSGDAQYRSVNMTGSKLDSPNTTSAQTYTVTIARLSGGTNFVSSDGNDYHIQAMEIAA